VIFFPRTASTQSTLYPYFSVWLKNSKGTILIFYEERNLGKRDSHVTKLLRNEWKEWISLLITYCSRFHFSSVCFFFFLCFCFVFYIPSWYKFIFVSFNFWKFNFTYFSHNYYNYSMFRDFPECSMFLVLSTPRAHPCFQRFQVLKVKKLLMSFFKSSQEFTYPLASQHPFKLRENVKTSPFRWQLAATANSRVFLSRTLAADNCPVEIWRS